MNSLPANLPQDKYEKALDFARLAALAYDADDNLVMRLGLASFNGIDDIKKQDIRTENYRKIRSAGNWIDWWGGKDQGLDYTVFENTTTKDVVIAFRGTEPLSLEDWLHDAKQAVKVFGSSEQYEAAVRLAREMVAELEGTGFEVAFTGHSLGGGLATAAALATGKEAIVFDAAGVSNASMQNASLGLDITNESKITNFNVRGCFVSDWNRKMDETTLGTMELLGAISKQYGDIFWLESISDRADFLGILVLDFLPIARKAKTFLAHAPQVYIYQLENKKFEQSILSRL